ncbi:MAG: peptidoglycan DD-metalloendopeptidase family protein [Pseudomonadota bacterium]
MGVAQIRLLAWIALALVLTACARSQPIVQQAFDPDIYIVQTGDTVYSISWRYGQDFREVIRWNKLSDPYTIYPGQKLRVRRDETGSDEVPATTTAKATPSTGAVTQPLKKPKSAATPQAVQKSAQQPKAVVKTPTTAPANPGPWTWPINGKILSHFSGSAIDRKGIDIAGVKGETVRAARGGRVVYSGTGMLSYGRLVIIKHSETFLSAYAHNSQLFVQEGDLVKSGQKISRIGTTNQGVAKLHFEIRQNGKPVNPLKFLPSN